MIPGARSAMHGLTWVFIQLIKHKGQSSSLISGVHWPREVITGL